LEKLDVGKRKLPFADGFFDAVVMFDLVEHLADSSLVVSEAFRVLKKGGVLMFSTPNKAAFWGLPWHKIFPDDETHVEIKSSGEWIKELERTGFLDITVKGVIAYGFPPIKKIRDRLRKLCLPVLVKPVFFPAAALCPNLYFTAIKS
jgi:SAM-dependent methyltransferase